MTKLRERELDKCIEAAFKRAAFSKWFLIRIGFGDPEAKYCFSRSDNPWGKITAQVRDPVTNDIVELTRECETDILVVFQGSIPDKKFALHIENKLADGKFTPFQTDFYRPRAQKWLEDPKYGGYTEFATVLIAPEVFHDRCKSDCTKFDYFVSHEDIAEHLPEFGASSSD